MSDKDDVGAELIKIGPDKLGNYLQPGMIFNRSSQFSLFGG